MFTQNEFRIMPYVLCTAIAFGAGFYVAKQKYYLPDVHIIENQLNQNVLLSYKQAPPRQISIEHGQAKLGTLPQRLDDLLNENPQHIRQLTKDVLNH